MSRLVALTRHRGALPEEGPGGWGFMSEDRDVGVFGGVFHAGRGDCEVELDDCEVLEREALTDGVHKLTVRDRWHCRCGARLEWTYPEVDYDSAYLEDEAAAEAEDLSGRTWDREVQDYLG